MRDNDGQGRLQLKNTEDLLERSPSRIEEEIAEQMSIYTGLAGIEDLCRYGGTAFDVEANSDDVTTRAHER